MKPFVPVLLVSLVLAGCGGRAANPTMAYQPGDNQLSCEAIEQELTFVQAEIQEILPKTDKTGKNVALGVAGWFLIVPWFFMDFKNADKVEYEGYRQRYQRLASLSSSKNCGEVDSDRYASIEEIEQMIEEARQEDQADL